MVVAPVVELWRVGRGIDFGRVSKAGALQPSEGTAITSLFLFTASIACARLWASLPSARICSHPCVFAKARVRVMTGIFRVSIASMKR